MNVRYKKSLEPVYTDGRDIDTEIAALSGEAADQRSSGSSDQHIKNLAQTWPRLPEPGPRDPAYYDRPLLQEPVWELSVIPLYYFVGGLTGAALALAAAAQVFLPKHQGHLIRRCQWIGLAGAGVSSALLIYDLGRPERFFNMLRVFRPTSPMNVGAWILSGAGGTSVMAILLRGRARRVFGYAAGFFGLGLATYTGVLLANSAVPVWQESRRVLPVLFGASAMASVGSVFEMFVADAGERRTTATFGIVGQLAELSASVTMEKQASVVPRVGRPLKRGLSGAMWKAAAVLTAASVAARLFPNRSRKRRMAVGLMGALGSLLMRIAVEHAGTASARDARASFHQQRAGHGAAEIAGAARP
jgi:hypothetical protein